MRGRKPNPITIEHMEINEKMVGGDLKIMDKELQRVARIDERYGDGLPFDEDRLVNRGLGIMQSTGAAVFDLGRIVLWFKERLPHGDYVRAIERMNVSRQFAHKCAQAVLRLAGPNVAAPRHLVALGSTKLLELLALDDDQLAEFSEEGSVAGMTVDDVDRMSAREARKTIRRLRDENKREKEVNDRLLKQKDELINKQAAEQARREHAPESERNQLLANDIWSAVMGCGPALEILDRAFGAVEKAHEQASVPESVALARRHALTFLMQQLMEFQQRWGIDVDLQEQVMPAWLRTDSK